MSKPPPASHEAPFASPERIQSRQRSHNLLRWSPGRQRHPMFAFAFLVLQALSVSACASPSPTKSQETPAMTNADTGSDAVSPASSAEKVGRRFIAFIGSVKSKDDIAIDRVQDIMGISLSSDPIYPYYSHSLGNGWSYMVRFAKPMPGESWGAELYFNNDSDPFPEDMSPVCGLSFDHYHDALIQMGFRYRYGGKGKFPGTSQYDKDDFYVEIEPSVKQTAEGQPYPACVRKISLIVPNDIPGHP